MPSNWYDTIMNQSGGGEGPSENRQYEFPLSPYQPANPPREYSPPGSGAIFGMPGPPVFGDPANPPSYTPPGGFFGKPGGGATWPGDFFPPEKLGTVSPPSLTPPGNVGFGGTPIAKAPSRVYPEPASSMGGSPGPADGFFRPPTPLGGRGGTGGGTLWRNRGSGQRSNPGGRGR